MAHTEWPPSKKTDRQVVSGDLDPGPAWTSDRQPGTYPIQGDHEPVPARRRGNA